MTSQPTGQLDLDAIETRKNAATPGPWEEHKPYGPDFYAYLRGPYLRGVGTLNFGDGEDAAADREFVKHAREDVDALLAEVRRLQDVLTQIGRLHCDSPMGPCPVCIDADVVAAGNDGLMPYPCPTGRLAGAQDFDRVTVHACPPDGSGLTPCCERTPFELPRTDRMSSDPADVTCAAAGPSV